MATTLNIYTAKPRHEALTAIKEAALSSSGWIASHTFYSNTAATLQAVIEKQNLNAFLDQLKGQQFIQDDTASVPLLRSFYREGSTVEVTINCAITFIHDEPDLRHQVVAVPG